MNSHRSVHVRFVALSGRAPVRELHPLHAGLRELHPLHAGLQELHQLCLAAVDAGHLERRLAVGGGMHTGLGVEEHLDSEESARAYRHTERRPTVAARGVDGGTCMCVHVRACACMCVHAYMYARISACMRAYICVCVRHHAPPGA